MNYKKICDKSNVVIIFPLFFIVIGNMTLYNIKVQPFVKRAKGDWGEGNTYLVNDFSKKILFCLKSFFFLNILQNCIA